MSAFSFLMKTLLLLKLLHETNAFDIIKTSDVQIVKEGSKNIELMCGSDYYWEYCNWRHDTRICEFEWIYDTGLVTMKRCSVKDNVKFMHEHYDKYECRIKLAEVSEQDAGQWKCEMESYVFGAVRGTSVQKSVELVVIPKEKSTSSTPKTSESSATTVSTETTSTELNSSVNEEEVQPESDVQTTTDDAIVIESATGEPEEENLSAGDEDDSSSSGSFGDLSTVLSTCGAVLAVLILTVIVIVVVSRRRKRRKSVLEMDWKERKGQVNHLDVSGILEGEEKPATEEDDDDDETNKDAKIDIDVEKQRMTYQGSRTMSYEEK